MARHPWLVHSDLIDDLADRPFADSDGVKDPAPSGFGDHLEDRQGCCHCKNIYQSIYMCKRMKSARDPRQPELWSTARRTVAGAEFSEDGVDHPCDHGARLGARHAELLPHPQPRL